MFDTETQDPHQEMVFTNILLKKEDAIFFARYNVNNRRQSERLGGGSNPSGRSEVSSGPLGTTREKPSHQQLGVSGNPKSHKGIRNHTKRQTSINHVGQRYNVSYAEKNGFSQIRIKTRPFNATIQDSVKIQHPNLSILHKGLRQSPGGFAFKGAASNSNGVRNFFSEIESNLQRIKSLPRSGLIRFASKLQGSTFFLGGKERKGSSIQRFRPELGEIQNPIRLSTSSPNSKDTCEVGERKIRTPYPNSSSLEALLLDYPTTKESSPKLAPRPFDSRYISTDTIRQKERRQQKILPNRIHFIKGFLTNMDRGLVNKLSSSVSDSSLVTYQFYWKKFYEFVKENRLFYSFSQNNLLQFFNRMIDSGISYNYLLGIRSSLMIPLQLLWPKYNLFSDIKIQLLFSHFKTHYKKPKTFFPRWDLDKVATFLTSDCFIEKCKDDIELFFKKVLFFSGLACPKRISEFNAISIPDSQFIRNRVVILRPHPRFFAKNHSVKFYPKDIEIPVNPGSKACPVALLHDYLKLSKEICSSLEIERPPQLWINKKGIPISKKQLNHWFRSIILMGDPDAKEADLSFHSLRGIAATNLFRRFDIETAMSSMGWKSSSTFFNYYAKTGCFATTRLVVAGNIIN